MKVRAEIQTSDPVRGYAVDHAAKSDRFDSVDYALKDATDRLARNYTQLEELAGKLFGYTYAAPPPDATPCSTVQPSVVERLNNSVESLQHANYRLEELISAFQQ